MLSIERIGLPAWLIAQLKHLASLNNPMFYENERLRVEQRMWETQPAVELLGHGGVTGISAERPDSPLAGRGHLAGRLASLEHQAMRLKDAFEFLDGGSGQAVGSLAVGLAPFVGRSLDESEGSTGYCRPMIRRRMATADDTLRQPGPDF